MNSAILNKENILNNISSYELLIHYLKPFRNGRDLTKGKNFQNPFRSKQKTPSFNIYQHTKTGEWLYKDFAHSDDEGSVFDLIMRLHRCDFSEALQLINQDHALGLQSGAKASAPKVELSAFEIWDQTHKNYWERYGITLEHLTHFEVLPVRYYAVKHLTITPKKKEPTFAYRITSNSYKIYNPLSQKGFRFCWLGHKPQDYVFGYKQLPKTGNKVVLTGGEKDVIALFTKGVSAISLNSETATVPPELILELKERFKEVLVLYDSDKTGVENAHKIATKYGINRIILPNSVVENGGKDVADFFAMDGTLEDTDVNIEVYPDIPLLKAEKTETELSKLLEIQTQLKVLKSGIIIRSKPLLTQFGDGVIYPRTINTIRGKAGVHKSRVAQAICSALIKKDDCTNGPIGFKKNMEQPCTVCYIDTERNLQEQFPSAIQQILHKAGYDRSENPENFNYTSLLQTNRKKRFEALKSYLSNIREKHTGFIVVVLDVLTDCLSDFNSIEDTLELLDLMNMLSNDLEVSFVTVIHENPGVGDKARGHLGTEANHKATTEIRICYEKGHDTDSLEILKYSITKLRVGKIPLPKYLRYCEEIHDLVVADEDEIQELIRPETQKPYVFEIQQYLSTKLKGKITRKELLKALQKVINCSTKTLDSRLKLFVEGKVSIPPLKNDPAKIPRWLVREEKGREVWYSLRTDYLFKK